MSENGFWVSLTKVHKIAITVIAIVAVLSMIVTPIAGYYKIQTKLGEIDTLKTEISKLSSTLAVTNTELIALNRELATTRAQLLDRGVISQ